jgi:transposase
MLRYMDRSTIHYLKQKGWTNSQIAAFVGHHRDTITRVLREPLDKQPAPRPRQALAAVFEAQIQGWLAQGLSVQRMLELAREDPDHPFVGSDVAFYTYVRPLRRARAALPAQVAIRFEGLPGELLQIDWGEVRQMPFTRSGWAGQTRYFFAGRLKYSRYMWVLFTKDMQEETLLRCLIACLVELEGVPWVVTSDNMKTITLGRDAQQQPIWHPAYQKFAVEFGFHPVVCALGAGNQKGAVENLVKFVKINFLAGRTFYDDDDLAAECAAWLHRVNVERPSDATGQLPAALLAEERPHFTALPAVAADYGLFDSVLVSRESLVTIATNRYSVPSSLVGQPLTARLHQHRIALFRGAEQVAVHPRSYGRHQRIVIPEHFEAVFALKPRARVMVYRDWLVGLSAGAATYVSLLCQRRYAEMDTQIPALYALAQQVGRAEFLAAVELATEHQIVGAEYLRALLAAPVPPARAATSLPAEGVLAQVPAQREVERDLASYEAYVANAAAVSYVAPGGRA